MEPHLQQLCDFFVQEDSSFLATLASINDDAAEAVESRAVLPQKSSATRDVEMRAAPASADDCAKAEAPYFNYKDYSAMEDPNPSVPVTAPGRIPNFPAKMYAILNRRDLQDIVSWMPHGRSWKVHKPREFEIKVIPTYFEHSKFSSFIRQANGWGFRRMIAKGPDRNSYYHEMFLRSTPHLVKMMKRPPPSSKPVADASTEPDFYRIAEERPLPELKSGGDQCNFAAEAKNILAHCKLVERSEQDQDHMISRKVRRTSIQHTSPAHTIPSPTFAPSNGLVASRGSPPPPTHAIAAPVFVPSHHPQPVGYARPTEVPYPSYQTQVVSTPQPQYIVQVDQSKTVVPVAPPAAPGTQAERDSRMFSHGEYCSEPLPVDGHHHTDPCLADVFIEGFKPSDDSFWLA